MLKSKVEAMKAAAEASAKEVIKVLRDGCRVSVITINAEEPDEILYCNHCVESDPKSVVELCEAYLAFLENSCR